MNRERVRFGVDLDRETESQISKLAQFERRSKRNFHAVLMSRLIRVWKETPDKLIEIGLVKSEAR